MRLVKIEIYGLVQGVGFRPFVYQLAVNLGLNGRVFNDSSGVKIELNGDSNSVDEFIKSLKTELPPLARIDKIVVNNGHNIYNEFKIISSADSYKFAPILPDFAICDECKNELLDSSNYRYNHAFINCTNCGPRFSLIRRLPYDRANTTMSKFKMCDKCEAEYKNPLNRRYHAQPIACKSCGPKLLYKDMSGNILSSDENALKDCINAIKSGKIVAIKGVGGFHLVCDGLNHQAIFDLRARKNRPDKPFAIMCKDIEMAQKYAYIDEYEAKVLSSNLKPIVLLKSKNSLPDIVARNIDKVGIFLPPTPLHILLLNSLNSPIIATSANLSKEPIIKDYDSIKDKLSGVCDFVLDNDRDIINPSDDSICFVLGDKSIYLRTSRGLKPSILPLNLNGDAPKGCFLALGALMKNQFAIYKDGLVFSSVYIGDMGSVETNLRFNELLESFKRIYDFEFDFVLGDAHPHFGFIDDFAKNYEIYRVYHHHAHALSVMLENGISSGVIALSFDGTGYGKDSTIWGGEVLRCFGVEFDRVMHFDSFDLIGGDKAIKNIYYLAYAIAHKYSLNSPKLDRLIPEIQKENLNKILKNQINTIKCSSLGRIFDAFASIIFELKSVSYDAQAPMMVESLYDESLDVAYEFSINDGVISYEDAFKGALIDEPRIAATAFINGLANLALDIASIYNLPIVLCGGVWQNKALLRKTIDKFKKNNIAYYLPINEPINDSAIAMGQIYFGLNMLRYNHKF